MTGGHGHVTPRPDGGKPRCGGPRRCRGCAQELADLLTIPGTLIFAGEPGRLGIQLAAETVHLTLPWLAHATRAGVATAAEDSTIRLVTPLDQITYRVKVWDPATGALVCDRQGAPSIAEKARRAAAPGADAELIEAYNTLTQLPDVDAERLIYDAHHRLGPNAPYDEVILAAAEQQKKFAEADRIFDSLPRHVLQRLIAESYPIIPRESSPEEITCFIADRAIEQGLVSTDKERQP